MTSENNITADKNYPHADNLNPKIDNPYSDLEGTICDLKNQATMNFEYAEILYEKLIKLVRRDLIEGMNEDSLDVLLFGLRQAEIMAERAKTKFL